MNTQPESPPPRTLRTRYRIGDWYKDDFDELFDAMEAFSAIKISAKKKAFASKDDFYAKIGGKPLHELEIMAVFPRELGWQANCSVRFSPEKVALSATISDLLVFNSYSAVNDVLESKGSKLLVGQPSPSRLMLGLFVSQSMIIIPEMFFNMKFGSPTYIVLSLGAAITVYFITISPIFSRGLYPTKERNYETFFERHKTPILSAISAVFAAVLSGLVLSALKPAIFGQATITTEHTDAPSKPLHP